MLYLKGMFGAILFNTNFSVTYYVNHYGFFIMAIAVLLSCGLGKKVFDILENHQLKWLNDIWLCGLLFMSILLLTATSYSPFIYLRF